MQSRPVHEAGTRSVCINACTAVAGVQMSPTAARRGSDSGQLATAAAPRWPARPLLGLAPDGADGAPGRAGGMWEAPAGTAGPQLETGGHAHSASSHGDSAEVTLTCTHVLALGGSAPLGESPTDWIVETSACTGLGRPANLKHSLRRMSTGTTFIGRRAESFPQTSLVLHLCLVFAVILLKCKYILNFNSR